MATDVTPKPRIPRADGRKNYTEKWADLLTYVEVTKQAIEAYVPDGESKNGQIQALTAVLNRMEGK